MWTADGVVLIDPAAHGGHRETDLAMLELFGCPFLDEVLSGYQSVRRLRDGWRERVPLHQLYPLLAHVVLFGGGYGQQTERRGERVERTSKKNTITKTKEDDCRQLPLATRASAPSTCSASSGAIPRRTRSSRGCRPGTPACADNDRAVVGRAEQLRKLRILTATRFRRRGLRRNADRSAHPSSRVSTRPGRPYAPTHTSAPSSADPAPG